MGFLTYPKYIKAAAGIKAALVNTLAVPPDLANGASQLMGNADFRAHVIELHSQSDLTMEEAIGEVARSAFDVAAEGDKSQSIDTHYRKVCLMVLVGSLICSQGWDRQQATSFLHLSQLG